VFRPHTVTFDCWQTLLYESHNPARGLTKSRVQMLAEHTGTDAQRIDVAFANAWREHQRCWHRRISFGGPEMTDHILHALEVELAPERRAALLTALEDEILEHEVVAIDGARELLASLRANGVRTALICDTGFSPGRVVRKLLDRVGLLELLEVQIFSDEVRAPKPDARTFQAALAGLGVSPRGAVHVGDIRRTDIAGAQAAGMSAVRFNGRNDDALIDCTAVECDPLCERPEADAVVSSYSALAAYLKA
jgi:putative hydrolase of the HAD superfamily